MAALPCEAHIGWTLKECVAHYGKQVSPPAWHKGNTIYYFHDGNLEIEAWINDETNTVTGMQYNKPDHKEFPVVEVSKLLNENGSDAAWTLQAKPVAGLVEWVGQIQGKTYLTASYDSFEGRGYTLIISFEPEDE